MALHQSASVECPLCGSPSPHVYTLPARVVQRLPLARPACYFCFIRLTGIKPTRRLIAGVADISDSAVSS